MIETIWPVGARDTTEDVANVEDNELYKLTLK
jgi:hypothetical protein